MTSVMAVCRRFSDIILGEMRLPTGVLFLSAILSPPMSAHVRSDNGVSGSEDLGDPLPFETAFTRLRSFVNDAPAMLSCIDTNGRCVFLSRRWYEFTGQKQNEGLGSGWQAAIHPEDRLSVAAGITRACSQRIPIEVDFRLRSAAGTYRWVLWSVRPRLDSENKLLDLVCSVIGISARKEAEAVLRDSREMLEDVANKRAPELEESNSRLRAAERMASLGTLSAGLGHDMGNILVPLRIRLDSLSNADLSPELRSDVEAIRTSAQYLQRLANGLRMLAADSNRLPTDEVTELSDWWKDASPLLRNSLPLGVVLDGTFEKDIAGGNYSVRIPRAALTQVVFNIVQNAGDAMRPKGAGVVSVSANRLGKQIHLAITDEGPGMSEDTRQHCMEPFFTTKSRGISTGMGLTLVYSLVRNVGGSIAIDSELGKGATFRISLTAAQTEQSSSITARVAAIELRDDRMRAFVTSELRALKYQAESGLARMNEADLIVVDNEECLKIADSAGPARKSPGRPVILNLHAVSRAQDIRDAIRKTVQFEESDRITA